MRALGIDLGTRRVGVAVSDSAGRVATPIATLERHRRDHLADHRAIADLVGEWEAEIVVVGLPLSLDGSIGPAARNVLDEVEQMASRLPVPVMTHDERFTTVTAQQHLTAQRIRGRNRTAVVDQAAAAVMLQGWLDSQPTQSGDDVV